MYCERNNVGLSRNKYNYMWLKNFLNFVCLVTEVVARTHWFYNSVKNSTNNTPFICVSHHGWDSKYHDLLGVSITFADPYSSMFVAAIGLQRMYSKKSVDVSAHIDQMLRR